MKSEQRSNTSGRDGGKNRDGVDKAFIENAKNDVHRAEGSENKDKLIGQRIAKRLRGALKRSVNATGYTELVARFFNVLDGGAQRSTRCKIER